MRWWLDAEMETIGVPEIAFAFDNAPTQRLPPRGVWPHALARVAIIPDVVFEVLRSMPSLVPSEYMGD
jgi:hypothetical protein